MNTLAKISIGASLAFLIGCSGKGDAGSRINNVDTDTEELTKEEGSSKGESNPAKKDVVACTNLERTFCAETSDKTKADECEAEPGQILIDACPTGGTKCDFTMDGATFYTYGSEMTCDFLKSFIGWAEENEEDDTYEKSHDDSDEDPFEDFDLDDLEDLFDQMI